MYNHSNVIKYLLENGASINIKNKNQDFIFDYINSNCRAESSEILVEYVKLILTDCNYFKKYIAVNNYILDEKCIDKIYNIVNFGQNNLMLFIKNIIKFKKFYKQPNLSVCSSISNNCSDYKLWELYTLFIRYYIKYTYKLYDIYDFSLAQYGSLLSIKILKSTELEFCLSLDREKIKDYIRFEYVNQNGLNWSGLKRQFF